MEFVLGSRHCSKGSLWVLQFFSLCKNQHAKIPVQPGISGQGTTLWMGHCQVLFIYLSILNFPEVSDVFTKLFLINVWLWSIKAYKFV